MEPRQLSRRNFLQTASVAGVAAISAGTIFRAGAAETKPATPAATPPAAAASPATAVKKGIFLCTICGHVEFGGAPESCPLCHAPKTSFQQNDALFTDAEKKSAEYAAKHVPVLTATKKSTLITEEASIDVKVRFGKVLHPMEEAHHIRFIDCYLDDVYTGRMSLTIRNHPAAGFNIKAPGNKVRVVALCNLHGHWQGEAVPA